MIFTDDNVDLPYIAAEVGPNWCISADPLANIERLTRLIDGAVYAQASAIKLQLKSFEPGGYYARKDLSAKPPWPRCPFATMGDYYRAREPDYPTLLSVDRYCKSRGIDWSASPWDVQSVELLAQFSPAWVKVASASLTDTRLLHAVRAMGTHVVMSTGMSDQAECDRAIDALGSRNVTVLFCVSTYPTHASELDGAEVTARKLGERYGVQWGYSGHETEVGDVCFPMCGDGAVFIERHFTKERGEWGPDHLASLDIGGLCELVRGCRRARRGKLGDGRKVVARSEEAARARLRGV